MNRRRKKRTNEQEYVRHLLFTVLSRATVERVLRQLRKLPWPASQPYVLKCVLKVCKGKYAQLALAASLVAGLARYHSAAGVALVDLLLEEIRVGMEEHGSPVFGSQRRVAQLRLLGELYNYRLVDHKVRVVCVCVCCVSSLLSRVAVCGSNGSISEPRDSPNESHASPPGGFPSALNRGSPIEPCIETLS